MARASPCAVARTRSAAAARARALLRRRSSAQHLADDPRYLPVLGRAPVHAAVLAHVQVALAEPVLASAEAHAAARSSEAAGRAGGAARTGRRRARAHFLSMHLSKHAAVSLRAGGGAASRYSACRGAAGAQAAQGLARTKSSSRRRRRRGATTTTWGRAAWPAADAGGGRCGDALAEQLNAVLHLLRVATAAAVLSARCRQT